MPKYVAPYELDQLPGYTVIESITTGRRYMKDMPSGAWYYIDSRPPKGVTWCWIPALPARLVLHATAFDVALL
jgi:hypothetical protein